MGEYPIARQHVRDQVMPEVVRRIRVIGIADQLFVQEFCIEHIDAHAGQDMVRIARHRRGVFRLFVEGHHALIFVHAHHAKRF